MDSAKVIKLHQDNTWPLVDRQRINGPENDFGTLAISKKWAVSKKGWPDFLCRSRSGEIFCVEVKPRRKDGKGFLALQVEQIACLDWLTSLGVRCYISDGNIMERYNQRHRRGLPPYIAA